MEHNDEWDRDDYGEDDDQEDNYIGSGDQDPEEQEEPLRGAKKEEENESEQSSYNGNSDDEDDNSYQDEHRHRYKDNYVELIEGESYPKPNKIRITNPYISKYQKAIMIGKRAQQIAKSSPIYIQIDWSAEKLPNALQIAEKQFENNKIPFIVRRFLPNGEFEDWKLEELKR